MDNQILTLSTFAGGSLAALGVGSLLFDLVLRDRSRINRRIDEEFRAGLKSRIKQSSLFKRLGEATSVSPSTEREDLWTRWQAALERTGVQISLEHLLLTAYGTTLAGAAAGLLLSRHWLGALLGALAGFFMPLAYVVFRRRQRLRRLSRQLPETFELMSRAVRAGQTMSGALQLVAAECKPPISEEFAYCCEQQNLGLPHEMTLHDLAQRSDIIELKMFAVALLVQRQSGGNPIELLDGFAGLMRKRIRLREKVRALTSEGRMQAVILCILPLVALGAIMILNRTYAQVLLDRPGLLWSILGAQAVGALWIQRIINFDY